MVLLNTLQAHCNPTLLYIYMKIFIIVQLNYHLGLIFQKSQYNCGPGNIFPDPGPRSTFCLFIFFNPSLRETH